MRCDHVGGTLSKRTRQHALRRTIRVLITAVAVVPVLATGCSGPPTNAGKPTATPAGQRAVDAARHFLARYVDADGRVVRRDQGGDTVSEGQGYALLLAVAVRDRKTFDRVLGWTVDRLQRPDGLFASHWANGHVVDQTPAADADEQVAWALALAARHWGERYARLARQVSAGILEHEVSYDDSGRPLLVAGTWAVRRGSTPAVVEPGYWVPAAADALATVTGDRRWEALTEGMAALIRDVSRGGRLLPPDWVADPAGAPPHPTRSPSGAPAQRCGPDGQRTLVWLTTAGSARPVLASWWRLLRPTADRAPLVRRTDGEPVGSAHSPLSAVAAAATAGAAGHLRTQAALLTLADHLARRFPTYYGSAWAALGRILLTTDELTTAAPTHGLP